MSYCHECGGQIPEDAKFCQSCGADQRETSHREVSTQEPPRARQSVEESIAAARVAVNASGSGRRLGEKKRWYDRGWVLVLTMILFFPLGFYVLYKNRRLSRGQKVGIVAVLLLIGIVGNVVEEEDLKVDNGAAQSATQSQRNPSGTENAGTDPTESAVPDLEVLNHSAERGEYGNAEITGRIKNNSGSTYDYVQIEFTLYDAENSNEQIGTAFTNTSNLGAGNTWRFSAHVTEDEPFRYRVAEVSGY